jgi:putative endonuclease
MTEDHRYHLYFLRCDDDVLYTGIAIDPKERLKQHQAGHPHGAKFTRRFNKLDLVYQIKVGDRAQAQSLELKVKKLKRLQKITVIEQQMQLSDLLKLVNQ